MHGPLVALISILSLCHFAAGLPAGATATRQVLDVRQDTSSPLFPPEVPSCAVCQPAWSGISSCAEAAPVFSDWMNILWNPLSFIDAIKCSCTDTFSSAFPQCVDCFIRTDQCEAYLGVPSVEANTSPILDSMRNVCGFASVLLGGVASSQSSAEAAAEPTTDWSDLSSDVLASTPTALSGSGTFEPPATSSSGQQPSTTTAPTVSSPIATDLGNVTLSSATGGNGAVHLFASPFAVSSALVALLVLVPLRLA